MNELRGRHAWGAFRVRVVVAVIGCVALVVPLVAERTHPVVALDPSVSFSSIPIDSWRLNGTGRAVLKVGNTVYVGGSFTRATSPDGSQSENRTNLAAFDATTGALITSFRADANYPVRNLQTDGTSLFVSGSFTTIGGQNRQRIAALDPVTGAVRTAFTANASGTVWNMSIVGDTLYVAGTFTSINGVSKRRIAAVSRTTGAVDTGFTADADATVRAIAAAPDGGKVYVGGPYGEINGTDTENITTLDATTGAIVGPNLNGVTGYVDDLEVSPDSRYLLAAHSGVPGIGNRTAVYDTVTGNRSWRHVVDGDSQSVHLIGGMVYAGFHDGAKGDGASRVAGYDLYDGVEDTSFHPTFDRFMGAFAVHGDPSAFVIAGDFSTISGADVEGFAIFPAGPPTPFVASVWGWEPWRYLDDGSNQGTAWRQPGYDDSSWDSGVGAFGYGNEHRTRISYGPSWSDKYITTYFRTSFDASAVPASAAIYMRVDDGAVVYVNGVEAARDNLPSGSIGHTTLAYDRSGNSEGSSRYFAIDPALIVPGPNTIAVEVHQSSPSSDDLTFFPTVVAYGATDGNAAPTAVIGAAPVSGEGPLAVSFDGSASSDADGSIVSWAWDFGDGATASGATAGHTYAGEGSYTATLTVTDDDGAAGVATRAITVTPPPPPSGGIDVAPTATWSYLDDGSNQGTGWSQLGYDDSGWSTGVGEFGYGDGDENTVVSYGPSASQKHRTTYFRTAFAASGVPADLTLTMRIDDGAVAYVNGFEAARFNMPPGPIDYRTNASSSIYGSAEDLDRDFVLDPNLIVAGTNVLAVEVHQRGSASSDLTFLASLTGTGTGEPPPPTTTTPPPTTTTPPPTTTTPPPTTTSPPPTTTTPPPTGGEVDVAPSATWSYLDDGSDQGTAWSNVGFDASAWATGVGEFGYGDGDENTVVSYGPSASDKFRTTYFRTAFSATGAPADLTLTMRIDDAAVAYLNGAEIARFNLPTGAIDYRTNASSSIYGSAERLDRTFAVDPNLVQDGVNVLAVEVHQRGRASSDLTFLASLFGNA